MTQHKKAWPLPLVPAILQERMITPVIYNWRLGKLSSPGSKYFLR